MPEMQIGDKAKEAAGRYAANLIQNDTIVGLGTGSTAAFFIKRLIQRCKEGLKIQAVATSEQSYLMAVAGGIPMIDPNTLISIDVVVDGADEIDPEKQMIKGAGGALLREKIIASMAKEMVVIVDKHKCVKQLGACLLPVEIVPFAYKATLDKLQAFKPSIRKAGNDLYRTDNGNYIADLTLNHLIANPVELNQKLHLIPGVIETGLFINMAGRVIIGHSDGTTTVLE